MIFENLAVELKESKFIGEKEPPKPKKDPLASSNPDEANQFALFDSEKNQRMVAEVTMTRGNGEARFRLATVNGEKVGQEKGQNDDSEILDLNEPKECKLKLKLKGELWHPQLHNVLETSFFPMLSEKRTSRLGYTMSCTPELGPMLLSMADLQGATLIQCYGATLKKVSVSLGATEMKQTAELQFEALFYGSLDVLRKLQVLRARLTLEKQEVEIDRHDAELRFGLQGLGEVHHG